MAHARLRRQMDDAADAGKFFRQLQDAVAVGDIQLVEGEILFRRQPRQARFLQRHIVIAVEIVDADDVIAPRQQRTRNAGADETGRARHEISSP